MGKAPARLWDSSNQQNDTDNVKKIISEHKNHSKVVKIKEIFTKSNFTKGKP